MIYAIAWAVTGILSILVADYFHNDFDGDSIRCALTFGILCGPLMLLNFIP